MMDTNVDKGWIKMYGFECRYNIDMNARGWIQILIRMDRIGV